MRSCKSDMAGEEEEVWHFNDACCPLHRPGLRRLGACHHVPSEPHQDFRSMRLDGETLDSHTIKNRLRDSRVPQQAYIHTSFAEVKTVSYPYVVIIQSKPQNQPHCVQAPGTDVA